MKEIRIKAEQFNISVFGAYIGDFISSKFGSGSAAETMRYFYQKEMKLPKLKINKAERNKFLKNTKEREQGLLYVDGLKMYPRKDPSEWDMLEFQWAITLHGETIFFPFTICIDTEGTVACADLNLIQLVGDDEGNEVEGESDNPSIGNTDSIGFLVKLEKGEFVFNSAIAWGDMASCIEYGSHTRLDAPMEEIVIDCVYEE